MKRYCSHCGKIVNKEAVKVNGALHHAACFINRKSENGSRPPIGKSHYTRDGVRGKKLTDKRIDVGVNLS